jgi:hypothetical protein
MNITDQMGPRYTIETQWMRCNKCKKRVRAAVGSKVHRNKVGHYLPGNKRCTGKLIPDGPKERVQW